MNKILAALVSMLMILGTAAPIMAVDSTATVTDPATTIAIDTTTYTPIGALTPGGVAIDAILTDVNGDGDIATSGYVITADSPLVVTGATSTVSNNGDDDNVANLAVAGIVVPYTTAPGTYEITVTTADGTSATTTITVVSVISVSASNTEFGGAVPGGDAVSASSIITNQGNVAVDFDDVNTNGYNVETTGDPIDGLTWTALTGTNLDDIPASAITTTYAGEDIALAGGSVSFSLLVPTGTLPGDRTGTITFTPTAV